MPFRPFLLLVRKRLIATAILSLLVAILAVRIDDVRFLHPLFLSICMLIGVFLGHAGAGRGAAEIRFLLTRPVSRSAALLRPLAIGCLAAALFPLAIFLLMLGVPYLEADRSRLHVLATIDLASDYRLGVALSLSAYTMMALGHWRGFGPKWLRSMYGWSAFLYLAGFYLVGPFQAPPRMGLQYLLLSIIFIVVFVNLYGSWRVVQGIDELPEPGHSSVVVDLQEKIRALQAARTTRAAR